MNRAAFALLLCLTAGVGALALAPVLAAQEEEALPPADPAAIRADIDRARQDAAQAQRRSERLESAARTARARADRTKREAAAIAARIQQSEALIDAGEKRLLLLGRQRDTLARRLAERRQPLVELTAALQNFARRPIILSLLRPGSLRDTVHLRAVLETSIPHVRTRTAALRQEIARGRALQAETRATLAQVRAQQDTLATQRRKLAALEASQRFASRRKSGDAARETDRALALAEEARDLTGLVDRLDDAATLRQRLAALPGPVLRPGDPGGTRVANATATPTARAVFRLQLPVTGRTVAGFGTPTRGGQRSEGITMATRVGAQVTAPAAGRVAFAGSYRGYGRIVIIDHGDGWTSLVTGLGRADARVGDELVAGAPIGVAGRGTDALDPRITLELRRGGEPVNPLDHIG